MNDSLLSSSRRTSSSPGTSSCAQPLPLQVVRVVHRGTPEVSAELVARVARKMHEVHQLACTRLGQSFALPSLGFDLRGRAAGVARARSWNVRLNAVLLQENEAEFMHHVIAHELAHLYTRKLYGPDVRPHGAEWKRVMRTLDAPVLTRHRMDTSNSRIQTRQYRYRCPCTVWNIGPKNHAKLSQRPSRKNQTVWEMTCKKCGQLALYTGEARVKGVWTMLAHTPLKRLGATATSKTRSSTSHRTPTTVTAVTAEPARISTDEKFSPTATMLTEFHTLKALLKAQVPPTTLSDNEMFVAVLELLRAQARAL